VIRGERLLDVARRAVAQPHLKSQRPEVLEAWDISTRGNNPRSSVRIVSTPEFLPRILSVMAEIEQQLAAPHEA